MNGTIGYIKALALLALVCVLPGCATSVMQPPVVVSVRSSLVNKGKVLMITNASDQYLHQIEVSVQACPASGLPAKKAVVAVALAPHATASVGWLELGDRPLVVGDVVAVRCHEYGQPVTVTVPDNFALNEAAR